MGKLTIQDVARILTEKNGLTQREANQFATEMFGVILQHLQQDEQVKVKGLGTFKIINVEARESVSVRTGERVVIDSHSKVTFTPDATMKELVNRPFSQFETVVLNEGVEFSDLNVQDDDADEEEESRVEPAESASPIEDAQPEVVSEEQPESVSEEQLESVSEEQPVPETEQPVPETEQQAPEEQSPVKEEQPIVEEFVVEEEEGSNVMKVLLGVLCILLLMLGSAYGGYRYGCGQSAVIMHDTVIIRDTIYADSLKKEAAVVDEKTRGEQSHGQTDHGSGDQLLGRQGPGDEDPEGIAHDECRRHLGKGRLTQIHTPLKYSLCGSPSKRRKEPPCYLSIPGHSATRDST